MKAHGVGEGDRVAVMLPTSINSMLIWVACGWLRALEVPIHADYRGSIFRHVIDHSQANLLVISEQFLDTLFTLDEDLTSLNAIMVVSAPGGDGSWRQNIPACWSARIFETAQEGIEPLPADAGPHYSDTGAIIYTSGTTGPPKGAMVPWRMFYKHAEIFFPLDEGGPDDTFYCPLPLSHIAGRVAIYNMALAGGRAVLRSRFSIEAFWSDIEKCDANCALLIGSIAEMLWRRPESPRDAETSLRKVLMAPLIPQVEAFKQRFGLKVRSQFGMTETMAPLVSGVRDDWDLFDEKSCGRPLDGFECRIADEHDEPLPSGSVGELLIRARDPYLMMTGYWRDLESTALAFRNQWFHTGDAFRCDDDGNHYFIDRMKDTIRRRGENISSFIVEQAILGHADVAECAVVGVESAFTEQEIHAFIVGKEGAVLDGATMREYLDKKLPAFMIPRFWSMISELPRTATQRVKKVELRTMAQAEQHD
jgi:crotonobetaine/carnitine-CoA ligase